MNLLPLTEPTPLHRIKHSPCCACRQPEGAGGGARRRLDADARHTGADDRLHTGDGHHLPEVGDARVAHRDGPHLHRGALRHR